MPRVHYRKARKNYPNEGIAKGDMYYTWKIRLARGGITRRSKTPPIPSQLTNSPFRGAWGDMEHFWGESGKDAEAIREAAESIRSAGEQANESWENMPESLQGSETGMLLEHRANESESKADELDNLADEYEGLEEPTEPDENALAEYEQEQERIRNEVDDIVSDMPEY